jgi:hypothetical protein
MALWAGLHEGEQRLPLGRRPRRAAVGDHGPTSPWILCDCLTFRIFQCPAGSTWAAAFKDVRGQDRVAAVGERDRARNLRNGR